MKQKIRLGDCYALTKYYAKRLLHRLCRDASHQIPPFFALCSDFSRAVCVLDTCRMREILTYRTHTAGERHARWANNGRRKAEENRKNIKESCVCTHAMAPAHSGLGLALGLVMLFVSLGNQGIA